MKSHIKIKYTIHLRKIISIIFLFLIAFTLSSCGKSESINNPIAIAYRDGIAYIINNQGDELSLEKYDKIYVREDLFTRLNKYEKICPICIFPLTVGGGIRTINDFREILKISA